MKINRFTLVCAVAAALALVLSCSKKGNAPVEENLTPVETPASGTINATISDLLTKVAFEPSYDANSKPESMSLTWAAGDAIRVYDHADKTKYSDFSIDPSSIGQKAGVFTGTPISASSYDVEIINGSFDYAAQTQPSDGVTTDLKYMASASGVTDYSSIVFSDFSSVLAITVQMPSTAVAAVIKSVDITASEDIFAGGNSLTITLDSVGDTDADGVLHLFATLPQGNSSIPAGTTLLVHFNAPGQAHDIYTRFLELPASTFTANKVNNIKFSAAKSDLYAGTPDDGSASHPYLIGDKYQLAAMQNTMVAGETKYYKLIDNLDMTGFAWTRLNPDPFTAAVNLDGNGKTISHLSDCLFADFNGSAQNLTLEQSTISSSDELVGVFACTIKTAASTLTNVDIVDSSITSSNNNPAGIVSEIDAANTVLTDCDVTGTDVTGYRAAGLVYFANALVTITNCSYSGGTITGTGQYVAGIVGSAANYESVISKCRVEDATISVSRDQDIRAGGLAGIIQTNVKVKGCTVGTPSKKVTVNTPLPASGKVLNCGGFVGVCYGTITKDDEGNHSKAYVKVTSANDLGQQINLGGFAGYHTGTIEYSDADVDMADLQGQYIGGFIGYVASNAGKVDHCSVTGTVRGNNYTGMFLGYTDKSATITNNTASGAVTGQSSAGAFVGYCGGGATFEDNTTSAELSLRGSNAGGFAGAIENATLTRCSATGAVTKIEGTGNCIGGFAGYTNQATLYACYSTGAVDANNLNTEYVGGFIGQVKPASGNTSSFTNCYATGAVTGKGRWVGGFIGYIYYNGTPGTATFSKCYATGDVATSGNYCGGFIGRILMTTNVTIEKCYASGDVSSTGTYVSGFIGDIDGAAAHTISDCYSTGSLTAQNTRYRGGLLAGVQANPTSVTISRCYSSCAVSGTQEIGGLIGRVNGTNCTVKDCAAWNPSVYAANHQQTQWSSGAVIGTTHPNCHVSNTYRNPNMTLTVYCVPESGFDQGDIDGTTNPMLQNSQTAPFTWAESTFTSISAGTGNVDAGRWGYHGRYTAKTSLSSLASAELAWSSSTWDFSADMPTLK